jgi:hypothetical protein
MWQILAHGRQGFLAGIVLLAQMGKHDLAQSRAYQLPQRGARVVVG